MKYKIISGHDYREVAREVNEFTQAGWNLYGYLTITPEENYLRYTQTLVSYDVDMHEYSSAGIQSFVALSDEDMAKFFPNVQPAPETAILN